MEMLTPLKRTTRHVHFISDYDLSVCYFTPEFDGTGTYACRFMSETPSCLHTFQIFNYMRLLACQLNLNRTTWGVIAQIILTLPVVAIYFILLALLVKQFLAPNLIAIGRCLNTTGFVFGAIFASVLMLSLELLDLAEHCTYLSGRGSLLLAETVGDIINCYAVGMILLCYAARYSCAPTHATISVLVLLFGIVYMAEVFAYEDHLNNTRLFVHLCLTSSVYAAYMIYLVWNGIRQRGRADEYRCLTTHQLIEKQQSITVTVTSSESSSSIDSPRSNASANWWWLIDPKLHIKPKILATILAPAWWIICFLVPLVDERRPLSGWCKYFSFFWFLLDPLLLFVFTTNTKLFLIIFGLSCVGAVSTCLLTSEDNQPRYLAIFAFHGLVVGYICFKIIELESSALLFQVMSFLFNCSTDIIALVAYPMPYIIMVVFLGSALLQRGYADMVYGIVIGIPLCLPYISFPILTLKLCHPSFNKVNLTANTETSFVIYTIMLCATIIILPTMKFQLRRSLAYYLLALYLIFLLFMLLCALFVIHPYGGIHAAAIQHVHHSEWA